MNNVVRIGSDLSCTLQIIQGLMVDRKFRGESMIINSKGTYGRFICSLPFIEGHGPGGAQLSNQGLARAETPCPSLLEEIVGP